MWTLRVSSKISLLVLASFLSQSTGKVCLEHYFSISGSISLLVAPRVMVKWVLLSECSELQMYLGHITAQEARNGYACKLCDERVVDVCRDSRSCPWRGIT